MSDIDDLLTVRDLLRFAVTRFNGARLVYGHGTSSALDEAAFLLLERLRLPVDDINPWLDARLTVDERQDLLELIDARIQSRKPAAYLVGRAYIQGIGFAVDERVIIPRSFVAELLLGGALGDEGIGVIPDPAAVGSVLDLCTGAAPIAIVAANVFPNATVDAVDLSPGALEVAALNVAEHGLADRIALIQGDLFAPLGKRRYDLILANPPYVAAPEVDAFPPEYRAEPQLAHLGGADGLDLVRRILADAKAHLAPHGGLLCEVGTGRDRLETEYDLPFAWLDTVGSEGEVFWLAAADLP